MIKIETERIVDWDIIKEKHQEWGKNFINMRHQKIKTALRNTEFEEEKIFYENFFSNMIDKILIEDGLIKIIKYFESKPFLNYSNDALLDKIDKIRNKIIPADRTVAEEVDLNKTKVELNKIKAKIFCEETLAIFDKYSELFVFKNNEKTKRYDLRKKMKTDLKDLKTKFETKKKLEQDKDKKIENIFKVLNKQIELIKIIESIDSIVDPLIKASFNNLKTKLELIPAGEFTKDKKIEVKLKIEILKLSLISPRERLKYIFNYGIFSNKNMESTMKWGRHQLLSMMGANVCPYCQRNYISSYNSLIETATADLDHYYPKSKYQYLALSLYNFIPSCQICNSKRMKGSIDFFEEEHVYLYENDFNSLDTKFTIENGVDEILEKNENEFKVLLKSNDKRVLNSIETFKLNKIYETNHNGYLKDMIENIEKYSKNYTNSLGKIFADDDFKEEAGMKEVIIQILSTEFKNVIEKPYKYKIDKGEPLGKLTKDILEEYGIIL